MVEPEVLTETESVTGGEKGMTYNGDLTWGDLAYKAGQQAQNMIASLTAGLNEYNEWQSYRAGRTNAEIATALGKTESQVAEIDACFGALKEMYDYANNQTPYASDRFYSMRKFS